MKKYSKYILPAVCLFGLLLAYWILPTQGAIYINPAQIATGTPNYVLTTVGTTTKWAATTGGAFTTTTFNGLSSTNYTITASSTAGLRISTSSPGTINVYQDQATVFVPGFISPVDFTTFNNKQDALQGTKGSVIFMGTTTPDFQNSQFFWDNGNYRLGIGTTTPSTALDVVGNITANGIASSTITGDGSDAAFGAGISLAGNLNLTGGGGIQIVTGGGIYIYDTSVFGANWIGIDSLATDTLAIIKGTNGNVTANLSVANLTETRNFSFLNASGILPIATTTLPTASTTPCAVGEIAATSSNLYVCVSPNQWSKSSSTINW